MAKSNVTSTVNEDGTVSFSVGKKTAKRNIENATVDATKEEPKTSKPKTTRKTTTKKKELVPEKEVTTKTTKDSTKSTTKKTTTSKRTTKKDNKVIDKKSGDEVMVMDEKEFSQLLTANASDKRKEKAVTQTVPKGKNRTNYLYYELFVNSANNEVLAVSMVDSEENYFYAEATDFTFSDITPEMFTSVIQKFTNPSNELTGNNRTMKGTREEISKELISWINEVVIGDNPRDIVLVTSIPVITFDKLMKLLKYGTEEYPSLVSLATVDVNQDMSNIMYIEKPEDMSDEEWQYKAVPVIVATGYDLKEYAKTLPNYSILLEDNLAMEMANSYRLFHQFTYAL